MTPDQESHLSEITKDFTEALRIKYTLGQQEHGGNLWERRCLRDARNEALDLVTYLHCVKADLDKIRQLVAEARHALNGGEYGILREALNQIENLAIP